VGQESIVRTLQNALKSGNPSHAYLFVGSRGTGKTSTARIFAKGLNCLDLQDGAPCGNCNICIDTANGSLVDVIEIDAASHTGVENIRELRERANFMPNRTKRKIYIIDEVHMLSKGAFNALLKTLEEPPEHVFFLLATTELHKIPDTIISRCQTFTFGRFTIEQLTERLNNICEQESIKAGYPALEIIAQKAEGGLRDAISLLEQISAETEGNILEESVRTSLGLAPPELLENFYQSIEQNDPGEGLKILKNLSKNGGDFRSFARDFLNFLREKLFDALKTQNGNISKLIAAIEEIQIAISRIKSSPIVELPLEIALIKLCQLDNETPRTEKTTFPITPKPTPAPVEKKIVSPTVTQSRPTQEEKRIETTFQENKNTETNGFEFSVSIESPATPTIKQPLSEEKVSPPFSGHKSDAGVDFLVQKMDEIALKAGLESFEKKSFLTTHPHIEGNTILFRCESSFHLDQVNKPQIIQQVTQALQSVFGKDYTVHFVELKKFGIPKPAEKKETLATADDFLNF
jgi:DNA polymerase-3 subunit gamma/tau